MHIPEEAIEAAARADWASYTEARGKETFGDYPTFDSLPAYIQDKYRDDVRPMIEAAAPLLTPRTITSVEELDALPYESVVRDFATGVFEKWNSRMHGYRHWRQIGEDTRLTASDINLPATVLYTPIDGAEEE